eukprot:symbB.v1.2.015295.t2/scaffold1134.1/size135964/7
MAAIATDTEVRLRHAQTTAEQEQAASKATTSTLQAALAKANDKANATANQLGAVERENQALHEEVQRLRSLQVPVNTLAPRHSLTPQVPNPNPAQVFQGQRSAPFAAQETPDNAQQSRLPTNCCVAAMPTIEVIIKKDTASMSLDGDAKLGDVMKKLSVEHGIEVPKQVLLYKCKEFRMPAYEQGKLIIYDGEQRTVTEDQTLVDLKIDGAEPLVCGELQEEWLEEVKWGAFGQTLYEADYMNHREFELGPKPVVVQRQVSGPQPFAPAAFASPYLAQSAAMPSSRPVQQSVNPTYADRVMVSLPQGPPGNVQRFV